MYYYRFRVSLNYHKVHGPDRSAFRSAPRSAIRVRKELRSLTHYEYAMFVQGLATMMSVSTEQGQQMFGPKYRELDYFVVKHDGAHAGAPRRTRHHRGQTS
jgi:hypothetical protein